MKGGLSEVHVIQERENEIKSTVGAISEGSMASVAQDLRHELHLAVHAEQSQLIAKPVAEVFSFWRDFRNLPRFMKHLTSVEILSPSRSRWSWRTVGGLELEWTAEIIAEAPNRMISWQTLASSSLHHAGSVWFLSALNGQGTDVHVKLRYRIPGPLALQQIEAKIIAIFGEDASQILEKDLHRLKSILEETETCRATTPLPS